MSNNSMNIIKGIGTGLMAGMVVGYVGGQLQSNSRNFKKKTTKAMDNMGDLLDSVQRIFK